jgi:choline-sulfatase
MNRRAFLQAAGASALTAVAPRAASSDRPNLLFIMTDQQFADAMSCRIGDRYIKTPNMDGLAATGRLFSRAYCANPLCVPSRTSLFTGRYPAETGIETNDKATIDVQKFPMMGTIFQRAGYATGDFGKWHMPVDEGKPELHGFEVRPRQKRDTDTAELAIEFIRQKRSKPFLAVASFLNPHNICQWPRGEEFSEGDPGQPPALDRCPPRRPNYAPPKDESDIMLFMRRSYQASSMFPVGNFDEKKWREYIWAYYRMIELVDKQVGRVLEAVRAAGMEERTVVVFTADHGDCQGAHGWNQKTVFYEEAARVPFIVSCKGTTKPGTSDRLVHVGVDLIPTLCGYAGIPVPPALPGMSLQETANSGSRKDPREYVVVCNKMAQGEPVDGRSFKPDGRMVRSQRYKYCAFNEGTRRESLVDLQKDTGEMVNLAGDAGHKPVLEQHRRMLAEWGKKINDPFKA